MKTGRIEVLPIASESMGVRSLCTRVETPDVKILLDPSAALAFRPPYEPHPKEYLALEEALLRIEHSVEACDILTISHYHFDHVRPGATNQRYNLCDSQDRTNLYEGKRILAKDGRTKINPSQRRRAYYFMKDLKDKSKIDIADNQKFSIGDTQIKFSRPLFHGPENTPLGFVLATTIEYDEKRVLFAPDVQGPLCATTLEYIKSTRPDFAIIGGPPTYLKRFSEKENRIATKSLQQLATSIPVMVVDHHLLRDAKWSDWLKPILEICQESNTELYTMAEVAGMGIKTLEAERNLLYERFPPSSDFMNWVNASDKYKYEHAPPFYE